MKLPETSSILLRFHMQSLFKSLQIWSTFPPFPKSSTASLSPSHSYLTLFAGCFDSVHCSFSALLFIYLFGNFFLTSLLITWNLHHGGEHATVPSKKEIYLKFPPFHPSLGLSILLILPPINARNHGWQEWGQWRGREGRRNTERGGREERKCRHNLLQKV